MKIIKYILTICLLLTNFNNINAEEKNIISIEEIQDYYSYELNTINSIEQLNLPNELVVNFDDETSDKLQIQWQGEIDFNTPGKYQLTSSFIDYTYDNMPTITIELYENTIQEETINEEVVNTTQTEIETTNEEIETNEVLLTSNQEPTINARLTINDGWGKTDKASEDRPAFFSYYVYNSFPTLIYNIEATNLKPNTTYDVYIAADPLQRISEYFNMWIPGFVWQTITTDDNGYFKGICRFSLWENYEDLPPLAKTVLFFTNQNDSEDKIRVAYDNHLLDYASESFDINKTRLINPEIGNNDSYTTVPLDKNEINDKYLDLEFSYLSPSKNTPYTFKAKLVKLDQDDQEIEFDEFHTIEATTDSNGFVNETIRLGPYNDLEVGRYHVVIEAYINNQHRKTYNAFYRAQTNAYVYESLPEEGEIPVTISTLDDQNNLLPGATVVLRKDNKDGAIVDTWTSSETGHILSLTPGTYYLEETTTPTPFDKPEAFTFKVNYEDEVTSEKTLVGETIHGDGFETMYIYNEDFQDLVYCVNYGKHEPELINAYNLKTVNFYSHIADRTILRNYTVSKHDPDTLYQKISSILWNGHPNNKTNIKEKYNLSDIEFENVTQAAVHYFTDNITDEHRVATDNQKQAFNELIEASTPAPKDMILNLYVADHNAYQNLIGASFKKIKMIEITYKHTKTVEPEKPEEPKKQDKPKTYVIPKTGY